MTDAWSLPPDLAARIDALVAAEWVETHPGAWRIPVLDATASMSASGARLVADALFVSLRGRSIQVAFATPGPCPRGLLALACGP